jgi:hypothetical protein
MLPTSDSTLVGCLAANLASLIRDYCARQKVSGVSLKCFTIRQFPVLPPTAYTDVAS